jgi:undecaprenyl-diphosphatase
VNGNRADSTPADFRRQILIALFVVGMVAGCYFLVDRPAVIWARDLDPQLVGVFEKITIAGSATPYLIALAVLYLVLRFSLRRAAAAKRALFVIAAISVSGVTVDLLKPIVARWRPKAFLADPSQYGFAFFKTTRIHNSFPSGHAATALAVACALALLFPRLRVLWLAAAAVVASSRVIIGEHYPGDVLAGAWFGVVITLALSRTDWFREVLEAPDV